ncbi:MAG: hypothetical protein HRT88_05430 [Lentisphaeraceae bacterium]|nr:hypothetical protein [Lentisphaeraceae bacterium]
MAQDINYLQGAKVCVVFCQLKEEPKDKSIEPEEGDFRIKCLHGNGLIYEDGQYLRVEGPDGAFNVPPSAYKNIHPNDGTDLLKDCQYFVMVKIDSKMDFD